MTRPTNTADLAPVLALNPSVTAPKQRGCVISASLSLSDVVTWLINRKWYTVTWYRYLCRWNTEGGSCHHLVCWKKKVFAFDNHNSFSGKRHVCSGMMWIGWKSTFMSKTWVMYPDRLQSYTSWASPLISSDLLKSNDDTSPMTISWSLLVTSRFCVKKRLCHFALEFDKLCMRKQCCPCVCQIWDRLNISILRISWLRDLFVRSWYDVLINMIKALQDSCQRGSRLIFWGKKRVVDLACAPPETSTWHPNRLEKVIDMTLSVSSGRRCYHDSCYDALWSFWSMSLWKMIFRW